MKKRVKYSSAGAELAVELTTADGDSPAVFTATVGDDEISLSADAIDDNTFRIGVDGQSLKAHVTRDGATTRVFLRGRVYELADVDDSAVRSAAVIGSPEIRSTMPGKILAVLVAQGDTVSAGDDVIILEAMKMENRLRAEITGTVQSIEVGEGDRVEAGDVLVRLAPDE